MFAALLLVGGGEVLVFFAFVVVALIIAVVLLIVAHLRSNHLLSVAAVVVLALLVLLGAVVSYRMAGTHYETVLARRQLERQGLNVRWVETYGAVSLTVHGCDFSLELKKVRGVYRAGVRHHSHFKPMDSRGFEQLAMAVC